MANQSSRRTFFKKIAAGSVTGSVLLTTDVVSAPISVKDNKNEDEITKKGYQETEHVHAYYRFVNF